MPKEAALTRTADPEAPVPTKNGRPLAGACRERIRRSGVTLVVSMALFFVGTSMSTMYRTKRPRISTCIEPTYLTGQFDQIVSQNALPKSQ